MNGFLHRLAARAIGTATPIHSNARLPFNGVEPRWTAIDDVTEEQPARNLPAPAANAPTEGLPQTAVRAQSDAPEAAQGESSIAMPRPLVDAQEHRNGAPRLRNQTSAILDGARDDVDESAPPDTAPPALLESKAPAVPTRADAARATRATSEFPLLMPRATTRRVVSPPTAALSDPRASAGSASGAHSTASAEPNEVHIHIGRIDVTAIREPEVTRRRPAATPSPVSLDDYLTKRGRS